jgi:hypothetical protein
MSPRLRGCFVRQSSDSSKRNDVVHDADSSSKGSEGWLVGELRAGNARIAARLLV